MQGQEDMIIAIFAVSALIALVMVLMVIGFLLMYQKRIANQKSKVQQMEIDFQKALLKQSFTSQEDERQRIAKDLHDDVGAMLSTIRLFMGKLVENPSEKKPNNSLKETTFEAIDETIQSVRRISHDLLPPTLERFGLAHSLSVLMKNVSSTGKLTAECKAGDSWKRLPVEMEKPLFRIGQELLNNSLKHAKADEINLHLKIENHTAFFEYSDNGVGIPQELLDRQNPKGLGLQNIESRASLIGATTKWLIEKEQGMGIQIIIPIEKTATDLIDE